MIFTVAPVVPDTKKESFDANGENLRRQWKSCIKLDSVDGSTTGGVTAIMTAKSYRWLLKSGKP